jgi:hypothetical protein
MSNDDNDMMIDYEEMSGDDLLEVVYSQRDEIADLRQIVAEVEYEGNENRAEIRRHHEAFTKVQGLLSDIEGEIFNAHDPLDADTALDEIAGLVRSIRNIVG